MSVNKLPLFLLQEEPDITEIIHEPLKSTQRIKYTCFDVSRNLIAFGATSGGIYVFNSHPCEFVQLIPNKNGPITRLSISPDEKHICFANGKGVVTVTDCDPTLAANHKYVSSKEHQGNEITALVWSSSNTLFVGDDIGRISVLVLPNFIAKTIFQSGSQTIMNLDSRICQLDVKDYMLLVSTLTRCYICDTSVEQYRQIGQKLRDGEFGACFVTRDKRAISPVNVTQNIAEVKKYTIADDGAFSCNDKMCNTFIYCARPSSRVWEASIDGTVQRTHQFKQVLARAPANVITSESYNNSDVFIDKFADANRSQSCNFPKIYCIKGSAIVSFKRDALYFLDINDVDNTMWFDTYKDILDCKIHNSIMYLWLQNGCIAKLRYIKIDKYLMRCFLDKKYELCAELCNLYKDYFISNDNLSTKLNALIALKDKISDEKANSIDEVLNKFDKLKCSDTCSVKSGIHVVDNTYHTKTTYLSDDDDDVVTNGETKLPTLKELSHTMTDKLNTSKKILMEKWEGFEDKMKHFGEQKRQNVEIEVPKGYHDKDSNITMPVYDNNVIVHKQYIEKELEVETSVNIEDDKLTEVGRICKKLYQQYNLNAIDDNTDRTSIVNIIDRYNCDIFEIHKLMLALHDYCTTINALQECQFMPNTIFLSYLTDSSKRADLLSTIIENETLYKYFVDSCIAVNKRTQKLSNLGCVCGFPLPFNSTNEKPEFSDIIDEFIEKQWSNQTREQCYDVCKKMPYLWRKILYLRRTEDLTNILMLLLQLLDEDILHSFLPQFTIQTWDKAIQLYAVLQTNKCLNCDKVFEHISVKNTLDWDDIGALLIKSVGGVEAIKILERNADLITPGELSMKLYHSAILVRMFEKYDATVRSQLVDTIFEAYNNEDALVEICKLLRSTSNGELKNTSLPIAVSSNSRHWGQTEIYEKLIEKSPKGITLQQLATYYDNSTGNTDCHLCGLPYVNKILLKDGGLWVFKCGHVFHGACLDLNRVKLCTSCV